VDNAMRVIDETDADLRTLISADFGPSPVANLHKALIDWLHYKARRIPALPRIVIPSAETLAVSHHYPAISNITLALRAGFDVGQWLSDPKASRKFNHTADMMFNDWQIAHFHLGSFFQSPSVIRRTGPLFFVHISATEATLLDVQTHGAWTQTALLKILLRTNSPALERYEGQKVTGQRLTDAQHGNLRANGVNTLIELGGRAFMPGLGLMSSRHATRLVIYAEWFRRLVQDLKAKFQADQVPEQVKTAIYAHLGVPVRLGVSYSGGALAVIDKNRNRLVLSAMKPIE
jgi:hypothetical protein